MLAVTGGLINGVQTTMFALAAYVYPGAVRATGVGTAVAFGRSGAIVSGFAGSWAIGYHGSASFFGLIAAAMCATFVALALVGRHIPASRALTPKKTNSQLPKCLGVKVAATSTQLVRNNVLWELGFLEVGS